MSKHKKSDHDEVGKAGSPPSGTKNERPGKEKDEKAQVPKVSKKETGGGTGGGGLH